MMHDAASNIFPSRELMDIMYYYWNYFPTLKGYDHGPIASHSIELPGHQ